MSFEIGSAGVDVEEIMRSIRARIEEKKKALYTEEELREIAERRLEGVLDPHDLTGGFLGELRSADRNWSFEFDPETVYRSSRGLVGRLLESVRKALRPIQKLFWNPNPMISALSRQADLNRCYAHVLHNLVAELTRLNLEVQDLKSRNLQLQGRLEALARREKTLEGMVVLREEAEPGGGGDGPRGA